MTCAVLRLCQCGDPQKVGWSTKLPSAALSGLCPASLTQPDLTRTLSWAFSFCILSDSSSLCFFSFLFVFMSSIAHSYRSYEYPACHRNLFSSLRGRFHLILHIFLETRHPLPTDCGVVSTFAILTPVPPPTTSANSPDSRPNLSHLSHFLSQILFVSLSFLKLFFGSNDVCLTSLSPYI